MILLQRYLMIEQRAAANNNTGDLTHSAATGAIRFCWVIYWALALIPMLKAWGGLVLARPGAGDAGTVHLFLQTFLNDELRHGRMPLWNPLIMTGYPGIGDLRLAALHPVSLLHFILTPEWVINIGLCMAAPLGASLFYGFSRKLGITHAGAWVAGLAYGFSGFLAAQAWIVGDYTLALAYPWPPAVLWALLACAVSGRRMMAVACGALAWAVMLVSGSLAIIFMTLPLCVIALTAAIRKSQKREHTHTAVSGGLIFVLGILMALPHLYPAFHWLGLSAVQIGIEDVASYPLDRVLPEHLLMLLTPAFFGDEVNGIYWGRLSYAGGLASVGVLSVGLMFACPSHPAKRKLGIALLAGALFGLLVSTDVLPLFKWLAWLPGFVQAFRSPGHFAWWFVMAAALAAGLGWDAVAAWPVDLKRKIARRLLAGLCLLGIVFWATFVRSGGGGYVWKTIIERFMQHPFCAMPPSLRAQAVSNDLFAQITLDKAVGSSVWSLLLYAGGAALLYWGWTTFGRRAGTIAFAMTLLLADAPVHYESLTSVAPSSRGTLPGDVAEYLKTHCGAGYRVHAPYNPQWEMIPMALGVPCLWGSTLFPQHELAELVKMQEREPGRLLPDVAPVRVSNLTDFMGAKFLISPFDMMLQDERLTQTLETRQVRVFENRHAMPRAFFAQHAVFETNDQAALLRITSPDFPLSNTVMLDAKDQPLVPSGVCDPAAPPRMTINSTHRTSWEIVEPTSAPLILVENSVYDPWWKASAGGGNIPVLKANLAFRAVVLPPGADRVTFAYAPPGWTAVVTVSVLTALGCLLIPIILWFAGHRRHASQGLPVEPQQGLNT